MSLQSIPSPLLYQVVMYSTNKSVAKLSCVLCINKFTSYVSLDLKAPQSLSTHEVQILYNSEDPLIEACKQNYPKLMSFVNEKNKYTPYRYFAVGPIGGRNDLYQLNFWILKPVLHWATNENNIECVKILLRNNINVNFNYTHWCHFTALHLAIIPDHKEIAQLLLDHGAKTDIQDINKRTPLHWASQCGHKECVQLLLDHRADTSIQDDENKTALQLAIQYENHKCAELLVNHKG